MSQERLIRHEPRKLTDRFLKSLKPAAPGTRDEWPDTISGVLVRVTDKGHISFNKLARFPPKTNPTRRSTGEYPSTGLEEAREIDAEWGRLIKRGTDPTKYEKQKRQAEEEERKRQAEAADEQTKRRFGIVAEAFIREKVLGPKWPAAAPLERKGLEVAQDIRREFIPRWGEQPIDEMTDADIVEFVIAKKETAPSQARNQLSIVKRLLRWAKARPAYHLKVNPCADIRPKDLIGKAIRRRRTLNDDELFALRRVAKRLGYPFAPVYEFLLLFGLRLNEVADASWSEFNLRDSVDHSCVANEGHE